MSEQPEVKVGQEWTPVDVQNGYVFRVDEIVKRFDWHMPIVRGTVVKAGYPRSGSCVRFWAVGEKISKGLEWFTNDAYRLVRESPLVAPAVTEVRVGQVWEAAEKGLPNPAHVKIVRVLSQPVYPAGDETTVETVVLADGRIIGGGTWVSYGSTHTFARSHFAIGRTFRLLHEAPDENPVHVEETPEAPVDVYKHPESAMRSDSVAVKVGQVWRDNTMMHLTPRLIRIEAVGISHARILIIRGGQRRGTVSHEYQHAGVHGSIPFRRFFGPDKSYELVSDNTLLNEALQIAPRSFFDWLDRAHKSWRRKMPSAVLETLLAAYQAGAKSTEAK